MGEANENTVVLANELKIVELNKDAQALKFKDEAGKTIEVEVSVSANLSLPTTDPAQLAGWITTLSADSPQWVGVVGMFESVARSKAAYKLACYQAKPDLDESDIPAIIDANWCFEPVGGGRFGYAKAITEAEADLMIATAEKNQLQKLIDAGVVPAAAVADTVVEHGAKITELTGRIADLKAKLADQSAKAKASKAKKAAEKAA